MVLFIMHSEIRISIIIHQDNSVLSAHLGQINPKSIILDLVKMDRLGVSHAD